MADMTPEEIAFFESGGTQLPPGAEAAPQDPAPVEEAPEPAAPEPAATVEPAAAQPLVDASGLERLLTQRLAALEERITELNKPKPTPETVPDAETDPLGHMMHQLRKVNETVSTLQEKLTQEQQHAALKREFDAFAGNVRTIRDEFAKTTPDFNDAYTYIRNVRSADLAELGVPKSEIAQQLLNDELRLAQTALQSGKNPAAAMYEMAKRYGYKPAAPAATKPAQQAAEEKVTRLANGQFAAKPAPRAAATETALTLDGLTEASDDDLSKVVRDPDAWARIVGGKPGGTDIFH